MIQWVQDNIAKYKGNPDRMFIWAHSAGNGPLGTYIGRPELYGPKGVGVKGAIFMSGQFNILPVQPAGAGGGRGAAGGGPAGPGGAANALAGAGTTCGLTGGAGSSEGAIVGPSGVTPGAQRGGPGAAAGGLPGQGGPPGPPGQGGGRGRGAPVDPAVQLTRSSLSALKETKVALLLATAELDPGINGSQSAFNQALHDELCKDGPAHCPTMLFAKGESHMSEVFSIDTADKIVSGPILAWMKKVK
jgi:hypothetical protein